LWGKLADQERGNRALVTPVESTLPVTKPAETNGDERERAASPFEVAYSFFFLVGIASVAVSILVPAFSKRVGFISQNDLQAYLLLIAIVAVVIFQLSRIYFVLHHISTMSSQSESFLSFLERPWADYDKLIQFVLATIIIASPKFNFLHLILHQHRIDVLRLGNPDFPQVYDVAVVNAVLWDGAGYCLSLAICFYFLIIWDLNIYSHNIRRISKGALTEKATLKFREFFYLGNNPIGDSGLRYFVSQKFFERLSGFVLSISALMFISNWNISWIIASIVSLLNFARIIFVHREVPVNRITYIFKRLLKDFAEILSLGSYVWSRLFRGSKQGI
jgi:hypothetical protein